MSKSFCFDFFAEELSAELRTYVDCKLSRLSVKVWPDWQNMRIVLKLFSVCYSDGFGYYPKLVFRVLEVPFNNGLKVS